MDWSKIKTIFIISFLILDIYLVYEFFKIEVIDEYEIQTESSLEDLIKASEIEFEVAQLPAGNQEEYYLKAKSGDFKSSDLERALFADQEIEIISDTILKSKLDKPYKIKERFDPSQLSSFIKTNVLYGENYRFWSKDDKERTITYYQQYKGKPFYKNAQGRLIFFYNEDHEIIGYEQTYLTEIEELQEAKKIIPPLKAVETLIHGGQLESKSKITKVELGYYTLVPLEDIKQTQVMNPTWCFVVNDEKVLFVNAFEGKVVDLTNKEETKENLRVE